MSKRLKILALASWYPNTKDPQLGIFIKHQLEAIGTQHEVILHTLESSEDKKEPTYENIKGFYHCKNYYKPSTLLFKKFAWFVAWRNIIKSISSEKFDLIHVHVAYPIGFVALMAKKRFNIPMILSEQWSGYRSKNEYHGWLRKKITQNLVKESSEIVVLSSFLKTLMTNQNLTGNYSVIPNIVRFKEKSEKKNISKNDHVIFMNIADHIDSTKNISGLLKAFKLAVNETPNIRLIQIGGGPDTDRLIELANVLELKNNVTWTGRLKNPEVLEQIHNCDFGITNSHTETFSVVSFEFLAAKKPIIITECGGPIEFLPSGFGLKIPTNDIESLKNAILKISLEKGTNMLEASENVKSQFSEQRLIERLNKVYSKVTTV